MTAYSIALFLHIIGLIGLFVAFGLEWTGLRNLQRATTADEVHTWLPLVVGKSRIDVPSMLVLLVSGFYMARTSARHAPWIMVTLGTIVAIIAVAVTTTKPRLRAVTRAPRSAPDAGPMLQLSLRVRLAMTLGIIALMTFKPGMRESLLVIATAITLGIISAVPLFRVQRGEWQEVSQRSDD